MNNSAAILRALIVYAICIPLAIVVGAVAVSMANSPSYSNFGAIGVLALVLAVPILLRWHHPLLVLSWNLPLVVFFLPGRPAVYLPLMMVSLGISILQRAINKNMRFIAVPQITLPLACLALVALGTAKMTGGIGLHALGDPVMGPAGQTLCCHVLLGRVCQRPGGPDCIYSRFALLPLFDFPGRFLRLYRIGKHHAICRGRHDVHGDFLLHAGPVWNQWNLPVRQTMAAGGLHWFLDTGFFGGISRDVVELRAALLDSIFHRRHAPHQAASAFCSRRTAGRDGLPPPGKPPA
jgi:hypothetical protein